MAFSLRPWNWEQFTNEKYSQEESGNDIDWTATWHTFGRLCHICVGNFQNNTVTSFLGKKESESYT